MYKRQGLKGTERILPFDPLPRIISKDDWLTLENGLRQRLEAIDIFLDDIYNAQNIINDGIIPRELIELSWECQSKQQVLEGFLKDMMDIHQLVLLFFLRKD